MPEQSDTGFLRQFEGCRADVGHLAKKVTAEPELLQTLLAALSSEKARVKYQAARVLRELSECAPELLCPLFEFLRGLLRNQNSVLRWNAILILGNLASADREGRLEAILDEYLAPITGAQMIDANNTIRGATAIALAKPHLADAIASRIMCVERATYATAECRNVTIGHAIDSLRQLLPLISAKRAVHLFVSRQVNNPRAATRKKAQQFLRKSDYRTKSAQLAR